MSSRSAVLHTRSDYRNSGRRRLLDLWIAFAGVLLFAPASQAVDLPLDGIVRVEARSGSTSRKGSGFVVRVASEGAYVVTAAHVVQGVKNPRVALASSPGAWATSETIRLEGTLGEEGDGLAVLLVPKTPAVQSITKIPLAEQAPSPVDDVTIVGFPRVQGGLSVLPGRITNRGRNLIFNQHLAEGLSGSPMLLSGRVVGIVTRTEQYGIGVTVNTLRDFLHGAGVALTKSLDVAFVRQWGSEGQENGRFLRPGGIAACFSCDRVYVADDGQSTIQVFSKTGRFLERVPSVIRGNRITLDSNGNLLALNHDGDGTNQRIDHFGYRPHQLQFSIPLGRQSARAIDTDIYGREIFVTDISNHTVTKYNEQGQPVAQWGRPGRRPGQFSAPWGIAVDRYKSQRVYVSDTGNDRVQAFDRMGRFKTAWGEQGGSDGQFDSPGDLAVDVHYGNVFVLDRGNARIQVFSPQGEFLGKWGRPGSGRGEFLDPYGIAIDGNDVVFVLDTGNRRVQAFKVTWR